MSTTLLVLSLLILITTNVLARASTSARVMNHATRKWSLRFVVIFYLGLLVGLPVGYLFIKAFGNGFHAFWSEVTKPNAIAALETLR